MGYRSGEKKGGENHEIRAAPLGIKVEVSPCRWRLSPQYERQSKLGCPGPYLGFFVFGGKLRLRGQTPQTFTGISRIQTGFLVKHYVKKKISFPGGGNCPPCPPAMYVPAVLPRKHEKCLFRNFVAATKT